MAFDYAPLAATARQMIANYGVACIWHPHINTPVGGDKPWSPTTDTGVDIPNVPIAFVPVNRRNYESQNWAGSTDEIPWGTEYAYMADNGFVPALEDTLSRNGVLLRLKTIDRIAPADKPVLYVMLVMR